MVHRTHIERYLGKLSDLAGDLADLRYDALADFLRTLAARLATDADADAGRKRLKLAAALRDASGAVLSAAADIDRAWTICAPRM